MNWIAEVKLKLAVTEVIKQLENEISEVGKLIAEAKLSPTAIEYFKKQQEEYLEGIQQLKDMEIFK